MLEARPGDREEPPEALVARGWEDFLSSLDDAQLDAMEVHGVEARWDDAPSSLRALVAQIREVIAVGPLAEPALSGRQRKLETPRKRAQIDAFAALIGARLAPAARRIVDVGSGHGHLTRELAELLPLPVVGLERDERLAARARALGGGDALTFAVTDVLREGLRVSAGDWVVGLHACGELGDAMVEAIAASSACASGTSVAGLALVGCCLQKRRTASRRSLCDGPELSTRLLGLSNLTARDVGVEASRAENLAGRERRLALHHLLVARVGPLRLGAEIDGLNRRTAHRDLHALVARAFAARALPAPSAEEIERAAAWARVQHARARRRSLPRALLARVLEVYVLLDRARYLAERGFEIEIGTAFPQTVSARNLTLLARRAPGARLFEA